MTCDFVLYDNFLHNNIHVCDNSQLTNASIISCFLYTQCLKCPRQLRPSDLFKRNTKIVPRDYSENCKLNKVDYTQSRVSLSTRNLACDFYSEGARFGSQPVHLLPRLKVLMVMPQIKQSFAARHSRTRTPFEAIRVCPEISADELNKPQINKATFTLSPALSSFSKTCP